MTVHKGLSRLEEARGWNYIKCRGIGTEQDSGAIGAALQHDHTPVLRVKTEAGNQERMRMTSAQKAKTSPQ